MTDLPMLSRTSETHLFRTMTRNQSQHSYMVSPKLKVQRAALIQYANRFSYASGLKRFRQHIRRTT